MQKRSHKLLADTLLKAENGFRTKRYELAFLFGSFEPDCNPFSYLKGSFRATRFGGHNYSNSQQFIERHIRTLQNRKRWNIWHYYTLGKMTHYVADAFTFPHNTHYTDTMLAHHMYETDLRAYLEEYLSDRTLRRKAFRSDVVGALTRLHDFYMQSAADQKMDVQYIIEATSLLMAGCRPNWNGFYETAQVFPCAVFLFGKNTASYLAGRVLF